jgi:hydroxymethylpyrimidine pyrophosphatase-like HAD family hydrolase
MRIFVDVDGTLTKEQRANSLDKSDWWPEMIEKVNSLADEGHEIILWTGNTKYARRVAREMGINASACVGKPEMLVDNEARRWSRRIRRRFVTPEEFLEYDFEDVKKTAPKKYVTNVEIISYFKEIMHGEPNRIELKVNGALYSNLMKMDEIEGFLEGLEFANYKVEVVRKQAIEK